MNEKLLKAILAELHQYNWEDISVRDIINTVKYLKRFGYLVKSDSLTLDDIKDAVSKFQDFFGLEKDGLAGPKTIGATQWPRCGCPEFFVEEASDRLNKWGSNELNYFIQSRDSDLPADLWDSTLKASYDQITAVCNLTFKRVDNINIANIVVAIGRGQRDNFDGPSGTLAWAELPSSFSYRGQLWNKYDADETWTVTGRGIRLLNVACHETGHICGLNHSSVKTALMAPFYDVNVSKPQQNDDISRLQARYGKPVGIPQEPTPTPVPTPTPNEGKLIIEVEGKINIPGYILYKR